MHPFRLKFMFMLVPLLAILFPAVSGCAGDNSRANTLVQEGEGLRASATAKLRNSTGALDGLIRSAAAGQTLPANETKATTDAAQQNLNQAMSDLADRDVKLKEAQDLALSDRYREYLRLLRDSNGKLTETVNAAMEIPKLLAEEQYSLAGWDEVRTQNVVNQIRAMQQDIERLNGESESLRSSAERIRHDNPGDFEG